MQAFRGSNACRSRKPTLYRHRNGICQAHRSSERTTAWIRTPARVKITEVVHISPFLGCLPRSPCRQICETVWLSLCDGFHAHFRFAFGIAIQHINKRRSFHGARLLLGVVKSLVSPFVSKVSISPSAIPLAAIAVIDPSSKVFLQLRLPSPSFINSIKSPEIRFSADLIFHSITEYCGKLRMNLPV